MVEVGNNVSTTLTANQTIPFTVNTFDTNGRIYFEQSTNSIVITKVGNYEVNGSFVFEPTSAGNVTFTAFANGIAIPYDISKFTATSGDVYTFTLPKKMINVITSTSGNVVRITFTVDQDGTLVNALASVNYVE